MFERFTDRARKVMQLANKEAQRLNHEYIGTEHILLGLVKEGAGVAARVLKDLEIDLHKIRLEVERVVQSGPDMVTMGKLPQTPRAKKVIEYSIEEARNLNHNYVGTEHLLLGLLREQEGVAAQVLTNLGLKLEDVREEVLEFVARAPCVPELDLPGIKHRLGMLTIFIAGVGVTLGSALIAGNHVGHPEANVFALVGGLAFVIGIALGSWVSRNPKKGGT
jgi:hypothetical protein